MGGKQLGIAKVKKLIEASKTWKGVGNLSKRRISLLIVCFVLVLGLSFAGCGGKTERTQKAKAKKTATEKSETKETTTETQTPKDQAVSDLDTAQKEISETISEVETEIKEIEKIDTGQDNENEI
jgi:uncharacterized protein HemX